MHVTGLRYKIEGQSSSKAFRASAGTGRLRAYQCLVGEEAELRQAAGAMAYALTGKMCPKVSDVQLQLADDGGHIWTIDRRGSAVRVLMDGEFIDPDEAPQRLLSALLEHDDQVDLADQAAITDALTPRQSRIRIAGDGLVGSPDLEPAATQGPSLPEQARERAKELAAECAASLARPQLEEPRILARLTATLEHLFFQNREIGQQYREYKARAAGAAKVDASSAEQLSTELNLIQALERAAEPLLAPGVTLKGLQEELHQVEERIAHIQTECGLSTPGKDEQTALRLDALARPLEALCRLEAHARLGRALATVRQVAEKRVEPLHRKYLQIAEANVASERQVLAELDGCLSSLSVRLRQVHLSAQHPEKDDAPHASSQGNASLRNWFDKFKAKQHEVTPQKSDGPSVQGGESEAEMRASHELENARMSVAYAIKQLGEVEHRLNDAKTKHDGTLARIDQQLEELSKEHVRLTKQWHECAREAGLPTTARLDAVVAIVGRVGELAALEQARKTLDAKLKTYQQAMSQTERLIVDWRRATNSQKQSEWATPQLLITEAQGILRYKDAKRKRFEQLRATSEENLADAAVIQLLKSRRRQLTQTWSESFAKESVELISIDQDVWPEVFNKAQVVRALTAISGDDVEKAAPTPLFASTLPAVVASLYMWTDSPIENRHKLALLSELEASSGHELRLIMVSDPSLAPMLTSIGIAPFQAVTPPSEAVVRESQPAPVSADMQRLLATAPAVARPTPTSALGHNAAAPHAQAPQRREPLVEAHAPTSGMQQRTPTTQTPAANAASGKPLARPTAAMAQPTRVRQQEAALTERALRTLELLTGKKSTP